MTDLERNPLAPIDGVLKHIGLPRTEPLLNAISPENILERKLGLTSPGSILEAIVEDLDSKAPRDGLPVPPLPRLPGMR